MVGKLLLYPRDWLIVNVFLILRLKLIVLEDSLIDGVYQLHSSISSSDNLETNETILNNTITCDEQSIS